MLPVETNANEIKDPAVSLVQTRAWKGPCKSGKIERFRQEFDEPDYERYMLEDLW